MNKVPRWVFRYVGNKTFDFSSKKKDFLPKNDQIWPKIGILVDIGQAMQVFSVPCWWVSWWLSLYLARHLLTLFIWCLALNRWGITPCKQLFLEPYESELDPVDDYCPEDEKEVDKDPESQGCKSLWHLNRLVKTVDDSFRV